MRALRRQSVTAGATLSSRSFRIPAYQKPDRWASELQSTLDIKKPVAYSRPPRSEKPNAGTALRERSKRMARTRRSLAGTPATRTDPDVVDAVDVEYIAGLSMENYLYY
ncbi:hypothetical protein ACJJTC_011179 [Scirpophaga incertulas]